MTETGDALRAVSDRLLRDLEVLAALEEEKRTVEPGDPRLVELASRIREIAGRVLDASGRQEALTRTANAQVDADSPSAPDATIDETARSAAVILAEWRAAERRLADAPPGSIDESEGRALVNRLRAEYQRAFEEATDA